MCILSVNDSNCSYNYSFIEIRVGLTRMENKRMLTLFAISVTLLLLVTSQTGDITSFDNTIESEIPMNTIQTILDPTISMALSESGMTQQVSLRTTHELSAAEIMQLETQGVIFRRRGGQVTHAGCIYLVEVTTQTSIDALTTVGYVEQVDADSNLNDIQLDQSVSEIDADLTYLLHDPKNDSQYITGQGVTVAIIDTGIDWQHPDFYYADGGEYYYRFDGGLGDTYVDLNNNSAYDVGEKAYYYDVTGDGGTSGVIDADYDWVITDTNGNGASYEYGIDYAYVVNDLNDNDVLDIDETVVMLKTCKISQIWDQTTGNFYVRGVNLTNPAINTHTDTNGHGTHVAGTVAGGQHGFRTFVGVAPDAEIMMIKTTFYQSDIMDAVIWAVNEGADVISMSIGGYINRPLDGSTTYEQTFDWAYDQGVPSTVSAGNSANDNMHSSTSLPASTESTMSFAVGASGQSVVYLTTLWSDSSNAMTLRIQAPYIASPSPIISLPLDGSWVDVEDNLVSATRYTSSRGTAYITLTITYQSPRVEVETGTWTMYINNPSTSSEYTHTYIYPSGSNSMVSHVLPFYTIGSPATADRVIAVASYVTKLGGSSSTLDDISVFSSLGPRIDGLLKPEISAPGELIMSTDSGDAGGFPGGHVTKQGTSMACPHAAGVLALQIQCHPAGMSFSSSSLRSDLLNSADEDAFTGSVPNVRWGYGKIDAYEAVVMDAPVISEFTVDGVPIADYHSTEIVRGEWFDLSVLVIDDQSPLDLSVIMEYSEAGGPVEGSFPLTYDPISGRWNISLHATEYHDICTDNFTVIVDDPLFSANPHTVFVDVLNELPLLHATYLNVTSVTRSEAIEFSVDASDYRDGDNVDVVLCLQRPDLSWFNVSMTWNGSLFVSDILFNGTDQLGSWDVYIRVSDQDGGTINEFQDSFTVLNSIPTVSGTLLNGTVSVGELIWVDATIDDFEDGIVVLGIRLKDSSDNWYEYGIGFLTSSHSGEYSRASTGLYPGVYEVHLRISDTDGGSFQIYLDTITLVDTTPPTISEPPDVYYSEFDTGYSISWNATDLHPISYVIYLEESPLISGNWNSSSEFFLVSVDGLGLGSYNYTIVVTDVGGNTAVDTVFVHVTDGTAPNIDSPADVQYDESATGYSITWNPSDMHPASYVIYFEGSPIKSGAWNISSETITISVDGHGLGEYNYTLLVTDVGGNSAADEVIVTVIDGTSPTVDSPVDIQYDEFDTGYSITWDPSDMHPVSYVVYLEGSPVKSGAWNISAETITISVDGHGLGEYNYTLLVTDIDGNTATDEVSVTVIDSIVPIIDSPADFQHNELDTGYLITWDPSDLHPISYIIYLEGASLKSGAWNISSETITISVDGLELGSHNYTIVVIDAGSNTATDTVFITVVDGSNPTIDNPSDIGYTEGETGNTITWNPDDLHPLNYELFRDGVSLSSKVWGLPLESIIIPVDGLSPGDYNYTIVVTDVGGNSVSDSVIVTVEAQPTSTTTTTTSSTTTSTIPLGDQSGMVIMIVAGAGVIVIVIILIVVKKRGGSS